VEFFLNSPVRLYGENGPYYDESFQLTGEYLASLPDWGSGTYITTEILPNLPNLGGFLQGQDPNNPDKGRPTTYAFIAPKDNGVVDLYYWIFCPFSYGTAVPFLQAYGYRTSAVFP
jgi:hypothetical protein